MKAFVLQHKKHLLIAAMAILAVSAVLALVFTHLNQSGRAPSTQVSKGIRDTGVFGDDVVIHDSTEGEIVIDVAADQAPAAGPQSTPGAVNLVASPDDIWKEDTYAGNHTPVEKAKMADGSIGVLSIDKLKLSVNVFESPDTMEDMRKGLAHFPATSAFDGLVGISGHNVNMDGSDGHFKYLYTLKAGDAIHYKTGLGERTYTVSAVTTIAASDWSSLNYSDSNQMTLITCISGQPSKRLCVTAGEQK